jgi:carbonic anhydrase
VSVRDELLKANRDYAAGFDLGDLPMPPARRFVVVTCMDARIDPAKMLGLDIGDAHVLRNAGGLVNDDMLRSLVISRWMQDTEEIFVIGHTGCGMVGFTNDALRSRLLEETGSDALEIDFQPFSDVDAAVRESVARVAESPFLQDVSASGWVYDVRTGGLREVA